MSYDLMLAGGSVVARLGERIRCSKTEAEYTLAEVDDDSGIFILEPVGGGTTLYVSFTALCRDYTYARDPHIADDIPY